MSDRKDFVNGKVYDFDLQHHVEGGLAEVVAGNGIRVKCWKSLRGRHRVMDGFLPPFQLQIGAECNQKTDDVKKCKTDNRTLPIMSYAQDDTHFVATTGYYDDNVNPTIEGSEGLKSSSVQVAQLTFDYPTLDYITALPLPKIFTIGNYPGNKTYDVRHIQGV